MPVSAHSPIRCSTALISFMVCKNCRAVVGAVEPSSQGRRYWGEPGSISSPSSDVWCKCTDVSELATELRSLGGVVRCIRCVAVDGLLKGRSNRLETLGQTTVHVLGGELSAKK